MLIKVLHRLHQDFRIENGMTLLLYRQATKNISIPQSSIWSAQKCLDYVICEHTSQSVVCLLHGANILLIFRADSGSMVGQLLFCGFSAWLLTGSFQKSLYPHHSDYFCTDTVKAWLTIGIEFNNNCHLSMT